MNKKGFIDLDLGEINWAFFWIIYGVGVAAFLLQSKLQASWSPEYAYPIWVKLAVIVGALIPAFIFTKLWGEG